MLRIIRASLLNHSSTAPALYSFLRNNVFLYIHTVAIVLIRGLINHTHPKCSNAYPLYTSKTALLLDIGYNWPLLISKGWKLIRSRKSIRT